ncbi:MAG: DUF4349 domain-containing protein [Actinobacteria bacterium]|nr:DUF4349 domain-containing protein [Actinomycetota bacterium]
MDRFDDETMFAELRALRPAPRPEFAAKLDERAAAGFPRGASPSAGPFARLADRRRALSPRHRLVPVLATALATLVVATAAVSISQSGGGSNATEDASLGMVAGQRSHGPAEPAGPATQAAPAPTHPPQTHHGGHAARKSGGGTSSGETVHEAELPAIANAPAAGVESAAGAAEGAPQTTHRDIERSASVVLGTKPGEVSAAAAKVFEAVHAANGVVLHSKVQSGSSGATGAYFDLLIPSAKLGEALAAFSSIAEVRERHDSTNDITAPTVSAAEELRDSNAAIEGLLKELGASETEAEREAVEAQLREERRRHAAIRARLDHLDQRASMSEVTVRIVTGRGAGVTPPPPGPGSWGIGNALRDAGHILTIAAAISLIALALLTPIALLALALWLANRFRVRRLRERTLG